MTELVNGTGGQDLFFGQATHISVSVNTNQQNQVPDETFTIHSREDCDCLPPQVCIDKKCLCPPDADGNPSYWNPNTLTCDTCLRGEIWSKHLQTCVSCPDGAAWNEQKQQCVCRAGLMSAAVDRVLLGSITLDVPLLPETIIHGDELQGKALQTPIGWSSITPKIYRSHGVPDEIRIDAATHDGYTYRNLHIGDLPESAATLNGIAPDNDYNIDVDLYFYYLENNGHCCNDASFFIEIDGVNVGEFSLDNAPQGFTPTMPQDEQARSCGSVIAPVIHLRTGLFNIMKFVSKTPAGHWLGSSANCLVVVKRLVHTSSCVPCPRGLSPNAAHSNCECICGTHEDINGDCIACPEGTMWDGQLKLCVPCPDDYFWSTSLRRCVDCPDGRFWDNNKQMCRKCLDGEHREENTCVCDNIDNVDQFGDLICIDDNCNVIPCPSCTEGYRWDNRRQECVPKCDHLQGQHWNSLERTCMECGEHQHFDSITNACIECSGNTFFNGHLCVECGDGQIYDPATSTCYFVCASPKIAIGGWCQSLCGDRMVLNPPGECGECEQLLATACPNPDEEPDLTRCECIPKCSAENHYWDGTACVECTNGVWNAFTRTCDPLPPHIVNLESFTSGLECNVWIKFDVLHSTDFSVFIEWNSDKGIQQQIAVNQGDTHVEVSHMYVNRSGRELVRVVVKDNVTGWQTWEETLVIVNCQQLNGDFFNVGWYIPPADCRFNQYLHQGVVPIIVTSAIDGYDMYSIDHVTFDAENYTVSLYPEHTPCGCPSEIFDTFGVVADSHLVPNTLRPAALEDGIPVQILANWWMEHNAKLLSTDQKLWQLDLGDSQEQPKTPCNRIVELCQPERQYGVFMWVPWWRMFGLPNHVYLNQISSIRSCSEVFVQDGEYKCPSIHLYYLMSTHWDTQDIMVGMRVGNAGSEQEVHVTGQQLFEELFSYPNNPIDAELVITINGITDRLPVFSFSPAPSVCPSEQLPVGVCGAVGTSSILSRQIPQILPQISHRYYFKSCLTDSGLTSVQNTIGTFIMEHPTNQYTISLYRNAVTYGDSKTLIAKDHFSCANKRGANTTTGNGKYYDNVHINNLYCPSAIVWIAHVFQHYHLNKTSTVLSSDVRWERIGEIGLGEHTIMVRHAMDTPLWKNNVQNHLIVILAPPVTRPPDAAFLGDGYVVGSLMQLPNNRAAWDDRILSDHDMDIGTQISGFGITLTDRACSVNQNSGGAIKYFEHTYQPITYTYRPDYLLSNSNTSNGGEQ